MDFISEIMKLEPKFCVRAFLASRVSPSLSSSTTELTPSPPGTSSSDILEYSDRSSYNRTFADRKCHVTSMGKETKARSIIRLSLLPSEQIDNLF
jgi:hypothetical protein